jgi:hypothetical protein
MSGLIAESVLFIFKNNGLRVLQRLLTKSYKKVVAAR